MSEKEADSNLLALTAQIVAAHLANNPVEIERVPTVIREVYRTLSGIGQPGSEPVAERAQPAVPIKKSVFPDYIVCLEDGKRLKMLKRHLATAFNMTPEQYRAKWGLDPSYPMVAPNYAEKRSSLAKQIGLGTRRVAAE
ncbi:MucR family transcriptional regulator [Rhodopila sp.]|jgi:predicted transcriptional regulator|uniref:MucR family transcriptional regulator n=1 Tax=Rhodopila sp. TaxID=2480087 RepID=UPI002BC0C79E|nr:MucR family transcriptional regulator [Rhodopila sp.]HVZ07255.1 MucR family transcriptional regulator [Rhodopila sp.]